LPKYGSARTAFLFSEVFDFKPTNGRRCNSGLGSTRGSRAGFGRLAKTILYSKFAKASRLRQHASRVRSPEKRDAGHHTSVEASEKLGPFAGLLIHGDQNRRTRR
jgi:hypothetical protein